MAIKVYLDTNVLINIEYGTSKVEDFLNNKEIDYYFSSIHLEELMEGSRIDKVDVEKRLELLDRLCQNHCLLTGVEAKAPTFEMIYPNRLYKCIQNFGPIRNMRNQLKQAATNLNPNSRKFLEVLQKETKEINNIPSDKIFDVIDKQLSKAMNPRNRIQTSAYLALTEAKGRAVYGSLFNWLDAFCFYKDKKTDHSNIGRMYDASHAYHAQLCDILVTNDKRMKYKTEAVFHYMGVKTKVMNENDFYSDYLS